MSKQYPLVLSDEQYANMEELRSRMIGVDDITSGVKITRALLLRRALSCYLHGLETGEFKEPYFKLKGNPGE